MPSQRICREEDCDEVLAAGSLNQQKYCPEHSGRECSTRRSTLWAQQKRLDARQNFTPTTPPEVPKDPKLSLPDGTPTLGSWAKLRGYDPATRTYTR